jgi:hypothetical protein
MTSRRGTVSGAFAPLIARLGRRRMNEAVTQTGVTLSD